MIRRVAKLTTLSVIIVVFGMSGAVQAVDDAHGKDWRQLTETVGISWNDVAQICPRDGASPCAGSVGGVDLTDWVWATDEQVIDLFSYFEPDILTSSSLSGQKYFFTATNFLNSFRPTFSMTLTYQAAAFAAGWTASTDADGFPVVGSAGWGMTNVSIGGHFTVAPIATSDADGTRGIFLWRATGLGTPAVFAYDDVGQVPSPAGGTAVASVLANDWVGGERATPANVRLSQVSSTSPRVKLVLADGSVNVLAGVEPKTHVLVYRICNRARPRYCDEAMVEVSVKPFVIDAANDQGVAAPSTGGTAVASVLANDTLGGAPATPANVTLSVKSLTAATPGITLNLATGAVDVAKGTAIGTYALVYGICEIANPTNCDSATVTVTVRAKVIDAVNDSVRGSSKTGGTILASVLANDTLDGARATTGTVTLSLVSLTPAVNGIALDTSDGSVDVAPKTQSGTYALVYRICEIASPTNCDQATVTIDLSGK